MKGPQSTLAASMKITAFYQSGLQIQHCVFLLLLRGFFLSFNTFQSASGYGLHCPGGAGIGVFPELISVFTLGFAIAVASVIHSHCV